MGTMYWLKQVARCQLRPKVPRQPTARGRAYSTPAVRRPIVTWLCVGEVLLRASLHRSKVLSAAAQLQCAPVLPICSEAT